MFRDAEPVGIVATGVYTPAPRMSAAQLAEATGIPQDVIERKFGILEKPMPGPDDHPAAMGARAARAALDKAGVDPLEVDLVLSISEEHKEHPLMVSGIKIQQLVGARNAWAVDLAQRCCTTIAALKVARAMMRDDPRLRTVLLAGGYRNGDLIDYRNPRVSFMYSLAAAGGALLLRRGLDRNVVLEASLVSDGDFADDVHVPAGGTVQPMTPDLAGTPAAMLDVTDVEGMKARLRARSHRNFMRVIQEAVTASGARVADIDYLALLHMKRSAHHATLAELGLRDDQSIYLERYGHLGQLDPILSIELAEQRGLLRDGDLVVMASAGVSYAWGAAAIRWGGQEAG
ncbi:MAG: 3-oxoacyl-ACP synthase [Alphaproteobacteria bacterium]|nr:3-oxoacyl-ACP synthase [Alphaproteobacteria bacterium]